MRSCGKPMSWGRSAAGSMTGAWAQRRPAVDLGGKAARQWLGIIHTNRRQVEPNSGHPLFGHAVKVPLPIGSLAKSLVTATRELFRPSRLTYRWLWVHAHGRPDLATVSCRRRWPRDDTTIRAAVQRGLSQATSPSERSDSPADATSPKQFAPYAEQHAPPLQDSQTHTMILK